MHGTANSIPTGPVTPLMTTVLTELTFLDVLSNLLQGLRRGCFYSMDRSYGIQTFLRASPVSRDDEIRAISEIGSPQRIDAYKNTPSSIVRITVEVV